MNKLPHLTDKESKINFFEKLKIAFRSKFFWIPLVIIIISITGIIIYLTNKKSTNTVEPAKTGKVYITISQLSATIPVYLQNTLNQDKQTCLYPTSSRSAYWEI